MSVRLLKEKKEQENELMQSIRLHSSSQIDLNFFSKFIHAVKSDFCKR